MSDEIPIPEGDDQLLTHGPIHKAIASISVPMLFMMFTAIGFSLLDARYISLLGQDELTGIDITFPFLGLCSSMIYGGIGTGVSATIARTHAQGNEKKTASAIYAGLIYVTILCIVFTIIFSFNNYEIYAGLSQNPKAVEAASTYSFYYFLFMPVMGLGAIIASAFRGSGYAKQPAIYSIICMLFNAILTPLMAYGNFSVLGLFELNGADMGMKGAAISSVISYCLLTGLLLRDFLLGRCGIQFSFSQIRTSKKFMRRIFRVSLIAMLVPMVNNLLIAFIIRQLHGRGDAYVDAFSLAKRFELALIMLTVSLGVGTMIVIGASHAIGSMQRVKDTFKFSAKLYCLITLPVLLLMVFANPLWYRIFKASAETAQEGGIYFLFALPAIFAMSFIILMNFCFQGLARPAKPLPYTLTNLIIVQGIGAFFILQSQLETKWLYLLLSISNLITLFFIIQSLLKAKSLNGDAKHQLGNLND